MWGAEPWRDGDGGEVGERTRQQFFDTALRMCQHLRGMTDMVGVSLRVI